VAWALSRGGAVVHCCVSLATQQFKRKAYQQHCGARDNNHGDVYMVTGLSTETSNELVSCVLGLEEIGHTRCVRSAIDCNYQLCVEILSAIKFHRE
jgi:hypothetical protein